MTKEEPSPEHSPERRVARGQLALGPFIVSCLLVVQPLITIASGPGDPKKNQVFCSERKEKQNRP